MIIPRFDPESGAQLKLPECAVVARQHPEMKPLLK
jgi:hypothetical protein